jgi:tRNA(adenine34) deaminase
MKGYSAAKVEREIRHLQSQPYRALEAEVAAKRLDWFRQHGGERDYSAPPSPRDAYQLLLLDFIGLSEDGVPVIAETEAEIVWSSLNPCSTLGACEQAGLDTREVCRAVYDKSTQALISRLDPQLRFGRSYEEIRPYAHHCKEWIVRLDFEAMMRLAIDEARLSKAEGNHGYGAVVVSGKEIVGQAHDTVVTEGDPSLHAEVNAIRQAVKTLQDTNLCGAVLFSTCEPCPMCASLAVWANLTTIVYGVSIEETAQLGQARIRVGSREIIRKSPAMIEVIGDVLRDECLALYR